MLTRNSIKALLRNDDISNLSNLFTWSETPEGVDFWRNQRDDGVLSRAGVKRLKKLMRTLPVDVSRKVVRYRAGRSRFSATIQVSGNDRPVRSSRRLRGASPRAVLTGTGRS